MELGGGKYDAALEAAYALTGGSIVLMVGPDGNQGPGFAVKATALGLLQLPEMLRALADAMEKGGGHG